MYYLHYLLFAFNALVTYKIIIINVLRAILRIPIGFGKFHYSLLALCGLIFLNCSTSLGILSFILPSAQCDLSMSSSDKGLLNAMPVLGSYLAIHRSTSSMKCTRVTRFRHGPRSVLLGMPGRHERKEENSNRVIADGRRVQYGLQFSPFLLAIFDLSLLQRFRVSRGNTNRCCAKRSV